MIMGSSASRQRPWQRCATVDHSDIRGSSVSTRHHGRDSSGAALRLKSRVWPGGCRIERVEGSPLPWAATVAVHWCSRFPSWSWPSLCSGSACERGTGGALDLDADGPDEAEQLAPDGSDGLLLGLAATHQARV